jgi:hypothetical protein
MKWYSLQEPNSNLHLSQALRDVAEFKLLKSNIPARQYYSGAARSGERSKSFRSGGRQPKCAA